MFIVFEGIDGCGKSTQAKMLAEWLEGKGIPTLLTAEPTRTKLGGLIREILSGREDMDPNALALMFTADRYEHLATEILPALSDGKAVICERYYYSTIAYQAAQGVDRVWLFELNKYALNPDLVIFVDVKPKQAMSRKEGEEIFEERAFLEKVYSEYVKFADMQRVDGSKDTGAVFEKVKGIVSRVV
jgi:dTMP kinase